MTKPQRLRMSIDITMTILSIILMGGNFLFPADLVHEILGTGLFVLWGVHIALNRRWYASLAQASKSITSTNANDRRAYSAIFRGKYKPYRIMQTVINCCILICTIFLMISGIILSNQLFTFLNIQSGLGRSGSDLAKFAKGADFKGGKDFTRGSGADVKKYIEGLLK